MRRLLSYRDARLLIGGQTLSAFGDWAMWIVLAIWMKTLTGLVDWAAATPSSDNRANVTRAYFMVAT